MKLAGKLKSLRKSKMKSQQDVCEACGIARRSLAGYESGERIPSNKNLLLLAEYYDVPMGYLLGTEASGPVSEQALQQIENQMSAIREQIDRIEEEANYLNRSFQNLESAYNKLGIVSKETKKKAAEAERNAYGSGYGKE